MQALRRIRTIDPPDARPEAARLLPPLDPTALAEASPPLLASPRPRRRRDPDAGAARSRRSRRDARRAGRRETSAAAVAGAFLLTFAALTLGGCGVDNGDDDAYISDAGEGADTGRTVEVTELRTPSFPSRGFSSYDPEQIERERLDEAWRIYAETDRTARHAPRPEDSGLAASPAGGGENGSAGNRLATKPVKLPIDPDDLNPVLTRLLGSAPGMSAPKPAAAAAGPGPEPGTAATSRSPEASESWQDITPQRLLGGELAFPIARQGGGPTAFRTQWLLDRARFSPGVLDGRWGKNTAKAVYWLQDSLGLEPTGEMGPDLYRRLAESVGDEQPVREVALTKEDLAGPFTTIPDEPAGQAELDCLCYASAKEALAERFHTTVDLLAQLNPGADLDALTAGTKLWVPNVEVMSPGEPGANGEGKPIERIVISKGGFYLHAFDGAGNLVYHFPSTLGSDYDPSFAEPIKIVGLAWRPDFHYQPKLFDDVPDSEEDHLLPPGPNSPVGLVWMQLSKENYGIHGTAAPETIGYATSHGCVRLTNWDAIFLGHHAKAGVKVEFRE